MTLDEYFSRITAINVELEQISALTRAMGIAGTAHSGNKAWERTMDRQDALNELSRQLTEKMMPKPAAS
jgi:hypothetical protein